MHCKEDIDRGERYVGFPEMTLRDSYYHIKCYNEFGYLKEHVKEYHSTHLSKSDVIVLIDDHMGKYQFKVDVTLVKE